ncbi:sigma-54 interaction domain-containing protein [Oceanobacter mangrovi]|uniref:sigma-54 interaction domain-containing protein n=1 Tax=Oceanobacter mangrovi TaxID=2862510 RepID=UPI001C8D5806|nr:sigma-54-dependent Fis family transcriptional regulator [Oceanobacter mangrovi]
MSEHSSYASLPGISSLLDAIQAPAILMDRNYEIRAANQAYREAFTGNNALLGKHCYEVSHGYKVPCDKAGEHCPLQACLSSGQRQRILHIHNTSHGKEHVDVELSPVRNADGEIEYFVEIMHPVREPVQPGKRSMVGFSPAFSQMLELLNRAAPANISVLLLGESGTGKELAARYLHDHSQRASKPFVVVECSGLTESLFESELFGHEKGAFTGANQRKPGLVCAAEGGTLFLDEIGDIPLAMQVKLLRLIETGTYRPVGSVTEKQANFRLICATHRNLLNMVERGDFRQDLYYRISPFPVLLPSLHQRQQDIVPIANAILENLPIDRSMQLSPAASQWLQQQRFDGNIRELRNRLERAVLLCDGDQIEPAHLQLPELLQANPSYLIPSSSQLQSQSQSQPRPAAVETTSQGWNKDLSSAFSDAPVLPLEQLEACYLSGIAERYNGDNARLAQEMNISERTLYRKLARARSLLAETSASGPTNSHHEHTHQSPAEHD